MHINTHTQRLDYIHMHNTHTPNQNSNTHTPKQTHIQAHTQKSHIQTHIHTWTQTHICTHEHKPTFTHKQTHIHTHTPETNPHSNTYTHSLFLCLHSVWPVCTSVITAPSGLTCAYICHYCPIRSDLCLHLSLLPHPVWPVSTSVITAPSKLTCVYICPVITAPSTSTRIIPASWCTAHALRLGLILRSGWWCWWCRGPGWTVAGRSGARWGGPGRSGTALSGLLLWTKQPQHPTWCQWQYIMPQLEMMTQSQTSNLMSVAEQHAAGRNDDQPRKLFEGAHLKEKTENMCMNHIF